MNGGNQMVALNLRCHTDGGHWLFATKALQLFLRQTKFTMVEIFSEGSIHNGLKLFLEQPKWTMGWNGFEATQIHNGLKSFLKAQFTIVSDTTQIWNRLKSFLDAYPSCS